MPETKTCFVIAPIGEPESETRKRSDQILKHIIRPAAQECGYDSKRADEISEPGIITSQVIQLIVNAPLVIADLTDRNPNVFYELAIRHALKKPLVQIIRKGEALPFDVAATRTIAVDHHDLDSVATAKKEIVKQIRAVDEDPSKIDTPISNALDLQIIRQSKNPELRLLAGLEEGVINLRAGQLAIERKLSKLEFHRAEEPSVSPTVAGALRKALGLDFIDPLVKEKKPVDKKLPKTGRKIRVRRKAAKHDQG